MKTKQKQKPAPRRTLSNLWFLLRPWWRHGKLYIALRLIIALASTAGQVAIITSPAAIIGAVVAEQPLSDVLAVAAVYFGAILAFTIVSMAIPAVYTDWKGVYIEAAIHREILAQARLADFHHLDDPEYFNSFQIAVKEMSETSMRALNTLHAFIDSLISLFAMIAVVSQAGAAIVGITLAGLAVTSFFEARSNHAYAEITPAVTPHDRAMSYARRAFSLKANASDIRATRVGDAIFEKFDVAQVKRMSIYKRIYFKLNALQAGGFIARHFTQLCVLVYVAYGLISGRIADIGLYATLIAAASEVSTMTGNAVYSALNLHRITITGGQVRTFFEIKSNIETQTTGTPPPDGALSLDLRGVSFTYPNADFRLKNLNISIAPGEKIAIVGENGAGKTTLSKLLLRLYDTGGGEILYNGKSIRDYNIHALRRKIGVAFQDPQLYALTVRENMCVYNKSDDATLRAVLKTVGLDLDLDAEVTREFDESGVMLSGGEAQKLGLSRLLHGDYGLLLLDEPSSALDPIAEYEMTKLMFDSSKTTTIMIAHRLSTIRAADKIYLIADGEVAESGTHDELMTLGGKYAEMFTKQAENYVK
ncbi:MAG: ABC transporter ATP-binding protein/permease [Oscillospiraceae bacterium]|jgi:ATP-binding cassette subfamily B protein|nr:ABC transporter ATP-binding protein/permease [Oscillospiraceae bacterium]